MTIHDDGEHPRGQAGNAGQFRDKANSGPEAALAIPSGQAHSLEDTVDDAIFWLSHEMTGPDDLQRISDALKDAVRQAQGSRPASDPAIELVEWARTAQEFMRSDKSNDWGEEVAALDAILESDD